MDTTFLATLVEYRKDCSNRKRSVGKQKGTCKINKRYPAKFPHCEFPKLPAPHWPKLFQQIQITALFEGNKNSTLDTPPTWKHKSVLSDVQLPTNKLQPTKHQ